MKQKVELVLAAPEPVVYPMERNDQGYWTIALPGIAPGARYRFRLDGTLERPDPAARAQPEGVHGPSELANPAFDWREDDWTGMAPSELILYELHTGTFSPEQTFDGIIGKLNYLQQLGITAIELMPVNPFPGTRNWGYDGVYPFAIQYSYGGVAGLKRLVDAAHRAGIAVLLDVVYNHLGPDGNYLPDYAPYFTQKYKTPWGEALNFDDAWCDGVRSYYLHNAIQWLEEFRIDGLRLDAVHAIWDNSAHHFIQELREEVAALEQRTGRKKILIAEFDLNNTRYINPVEKGGYGLHGQWIDEFHHALHSQLTGETAGYYKDFGSMEHLEKAFRDTYVYNGVYSPHRKKTFGSRMVRNPFDQFVVFAQNHDQTGNRLLGDRLSTLVSFEALKLAAAAVLLSPYIPLLFMGEEYGEKNPFLFFVSHENRELAEAVRKGRREEFAYFHFNGDFPDPQSEETFRLSCLSWSHEKEPQSTTLLLYYKMLIQWRTRHPALQYRGRDGQQVHPASGTLLQIDRFYASSHLSLFFNFGKHPVAAKLNNHDAATKLFDSAAREWNGPGTLSPALLQANDSFTVLPESVVVFEKAK